MLISDLKRACSKCDTSGFQAGYDEWGSIQTNLRKSCPHCSGKGHILTELGENLWNLYRPMLQELIRDELQNKSTLQK
jgi:Ribonuclease G/E